MKRILASVLLFIFLFNLGGYLLLFQYLIYRLDNRIENNIIHNNYKKTELVQIKIPVHLPAVCNWEDYESINGQMQHNGNCYNYVGLKITRDTMFLLCLPNNEKTQLVNQKKTHSTLPKITVPTSKYDCHPLTLSFPPPVVAIQKTHIHYLISWDHPLLSVNGQPPELNA